MYYIIFNGMLTHTCNQPDWCLLLASTADGAHVLIFTKLNIDSVLSVYKLFN